MQNRPVRSAADHSLRWMVRAREEEERKEDWRSERRGLMRGSTARGATGSRQEEETVFRDEAIPFRRISKCSKEVERDSGGHLETSLAVRRDGNAVDKSFCQGFDEGRERGRAEGTTSVGHKASCRQRLKREKGRRARQWSGNGKKRGGRRERGRQIPKVGLRRLNTAASDLTGQLPVESRRGNKYILITNYRVYIYFTPQKSKFPTDCVRSFTSILAFFTAHSLPLPSLICDNETSLECREYFLSQRLPVQFVPPQMHRSNPAEKSVRTAKNHLISTFASTHPDFPDDLWDRLLPHAKLTLNVLRPWRPDPSLSAWSGLHHLPYDFAAHPLHPPGQLCPPSPTPAPSHYTPTSWTTHPFPTHIPHRTIPTPTPP
jgi:hypothetical protein